ncbi:MAG: DNA-primase RepB domain-containing protein [Gammaproteobacteria bacterium]
MSNRNQRANPSASAVRNNRTVPVARRSRVLQPDLTLAETFTRLLARGSPITFQTFADCKDSPGAASISRVFHGTFDEHRGELVCLNQAGAGIFMMINEGDGKVHPPNKTCRANASVVTLRSLFVDLDGAPLEPVLEYESTADLIVESSPGRWHVYWFVGWFEPLELFADGQTMVAERFGGDRSVKDLARVMRIPGFFHQKGEPFMSRLVHTSPLAWERGNED